MPPTTSSRRAPREVLFADREGFSPVDPDDVAAPGGAWNEASGTPSARPSSSGCSRLLEATRAWPSRVPSRRPSAWAGGEVALFTDGERSALGLALVDDSDTGALCAAVEEWYQAAFDTDATESGGATVLDGGGQVGVLRCDGPDVRLGIAPDEATASALAR